MNCIETRNLTHRFAGEAVVNQVGLQVPEGSIYGFLGPNGAGKTTTLRLILGLLKKQTGDIHVFGKPVAGHRVDILRKTGTLIESPSIYSHLTARENLALLQKIYQCPASRISEVLEIVGLASTGKKRAGRFSLGMKQRLSIAIALLHSPSLLILDEPTNGLDPNGIIEVRELLKHLQAQHGMTILVSSHLLAEIEKLATHVGIIHKGSLLFQGSLAQLQEMHHRTSSIGFETSDNQRTKLIFSAQGISAEVDHDRVIIPVMDREEVAALNEKLMGEKIKVYQIALLRNDLESIFIDLTSQSAQS